MPRCDPDVWPEDERLAALAPPPLPPLELASPQPSSAAGSSMYESPWHSSQEQCVPPYPWAAQLGAGQTARLPPPPWREQPSEPDEFDQGLLRHAVGALGNGAQARLGGGRCPGRLVAAAPQQHARSIPHPPHTGGIQQGSLSAGVDDVLSQLGPWDAGAASLQAAWLPLPAAGGQGPDEMQPPLPQEPPPLPGALWRGTCWSCCLQPVGRGPALHPLRSTVAALVQVPHQSRSPPCRPATTWRKTMATLARPPCHRTRRPTTSMCCTWRRRRPCLRWRLRRRPGRRCPGRLHPWRQPWARHAPWACPGGTACRPLTCPLGFSQGRWHRCSNHSCSSSSQCSLCRCCKASSSSRCQRTSRPCS